MSPGNQDVFQLLKEATLRRFLVFYNCINGIIVSMFFKVLLRTWSFYDQEIFLDVKVYDLV